MWLVYQTLDSICHSYTRTLNATNDIYIITISRLVSVEQLNRFEPTFAIIPTAIHTHHTSISKPSKDLIITVLDRSLANSFDTLHDDHDDNDDDTHTRATCHCRKCRIPCIHRSRSWSSSCHSFDPRHSYRSTPTHTMK